MGPAGPADPRFLMAGNRKEGPAQPRPDPVCLRRSRKTRVLLLERKHPRGGAGNRVVRADGRSAGIGAPWWRTGTGALPRTHGRPLSIGASLRRTSRGHGSVTARVPRNRTRTVSSGPPGVLRLHRRLVAASGARTRSGSASGCPRCQRRRRLRGHVLAAGPPAEHRASDRGAKVPPGRPVVRAGFRITSGARGPGRARRPSTPPDTFPRAPGCTDGGGDSPPTAPRGRGQD